MNFFAVFIKRPVATTLLTIAIALPGLLALKVLPRSALPQVDYPTISISASLPGANPEVMAATVAAPLERAFSQLAGVDEMTSSSTQGACRISLQFDLGRNIDGAARDVQAAINAARAMLPKNIPSNPTYRRVNASASPILAIAVTSKIHTQDQLYDIAFSILNQKISQVNGVGQVNINGSSLRAVRVEVNPNALNQYGVSLEQVRTAISDFNQNRPKGSIQSHAHYWQIEVNDQVKRAAEYRDLMVAFRNQAPVRLQDVAQVTDSIQELRSAGTANGKPTIVLVIYSQPGTNVVETVDNVRNLLPKLKTMIPAAVDLEIMIDRSKTVRKSLSEVQHTLYISIALVILVTFAFLRNARATLIPTITIPVALLGTLTVIYLLGYSLNNLSLMALIISASFVVDDAIVVVENTAKHLESGMAPIPAALKGIQEVGFTVLAMSLSLIAVFVPLLFMDGILGRLFREFAVTLSVAVLISLFVSLSTTPMLCARILRPHATGQQKSWWHCVIMLLDMPFWVYQRTLGWCLRHGWLMIILLFAVIALNIHLYQIVPKGFFPQQDTGNLRGSIQADQSLSFSQVRKRIGKLTQLLMKDPDIEVYYEFSGSAGSPQGNMASLFAKLRPLGERTATATEVVSRLRPKLTRIPGISLMLNPQQDLQIGARMGGSQFQYTLLADNLDALKTLIPKLRGMMSKLPQIVDVNTDFQTQGLALQLEINREAAARYGITPSQIDDALNSAFSQRLVSTIYEPLNQYYVVLTFSPAFQKNAEAIEQIYIDTPNNGKVPLMAISQWQLGNTPMAVNHQGQFVAGTISFNLAEGYSLDQATQAIEATFDKLGAPDNINGVFAGAAKVFKASLDSQPWLIMTALLTVYIVLGILYESFMHPLTIISTLPSAGVGALLALIIFKSELSIIALIGVILLVGIVMKNAIMMIDCALLLEREQGMTPFDSINTACLQRFRPILMTTLAAMLGALPLALGAGDGSEIRRPLGISIVGGLVFSQLLTLYTTPVVYLYLDRCRHYFNQRIGGQTRI